MEIYQSNLFGNGSVDSALSQNDLCEIVEVALADIAASARVLAIVADKTRDDNTDILFPIAAKILLGKKAAKFDVLIAQGTHPAMSESEKFAKIGVVDGKLFDGVGQIFDHEWDNPEKLGSIGTLEASKVKEITGGLLENEIDLSINKLVSSDEYDTILIFGGTVPHEVAGFAGGAKYFFPGIAGPDLTHATHWLGAMVTVGKTIGKIETPTRLMIESAADFIKQKVISFTSVVTRTAENRLQTHALFAGDFREAFRSAAEISRQVHIKYTGRKYKTVVAILDEHYDDMWVGGKASYKLGGIIEDGGELIIYAPHLNSISETHGEMIEKYGYAPMEIVRKMVAENSDLRENLCVAAHLTHVSYGGRKDENGDIVPLYRITLASKVSEEICKKVNLGFADFNSISLSEFENHPDTLIVKNAGRDLYLVSYSEN